MYIENARIDDVTEEINMYIKLTTRKRGYKRK